MKIEGDRTARRPGAEAQGRAAEAGRGRRVGMAAAPGDTERPVQSPREPLVAREPSPREPVVSREPTRQFREPSAPSSHPFAAQGRPLPSPVRSEPSPEPSVAPEPVVAPRATDKPAEAPEEVVRNSAEFSSLEDEMARLLDDLAGDSKENADRVSAFIACRLEPFGGRGDSVARSRMIRVRPRSGALRTGPLG